MSTLELMRPGQAAARLRVSPQTLRDWERSGRLLTARTTGGHRRFRRDQIERIAEQRRTEAAHRAAALMREALALIAEGDLETAQSVLTESLSVEERTAVVRILDTFKPLEGQHVPDDENDEGRAM